jgi:cysteinyl-tRNA synthetase
LDQLIYNVRQGFADAMDDDLNISGALVVLFEFLKSVGKPLSQGMLDCKDRENILNVMMEIDSILGIMNFKENQLPEDVRLLMNKRDALRKEGQWEESDAIRAKLLEMGFEVSDTPDGMRWEAK